MRKHCGCKSNVDTLWVKDLSVDMFAKYGSTKDASITVLKDAHTGYSCLACHGYWTCEMWERTEVIGTILLAKCNRKGVETESVTFLWGLVWIHKSSNSAQRSHTCSWVHCSNWFLNVTCLCIIGSLSCMSNCGRVKDGWIWWAKW